MATSGALTGLTADQAKLGLGGSAFVVTVFETAKPNHNFRDSFFAIDMTEAVHMARNLVLKAFKESEKSSTVNEVTIVIFAEHFDLPGKAWKLSLVTEQLTPCDVPCGECLGSGGIDSGGTTPEGSPITIPCPSCKNPELSRTVVCPTCNGRATDPAYHCWHCKGAGKVQETNVAAWFGSRIGKSGKPDLKEWTDGSAAGTALTNFQNQVWGDLDKYSKKLGWGLTGIQPECWALLDAAVDELVKAREIIKTTRTAIHVPADKPDDFLPKAAEMLMGMYEASQPKPRTT